MKQTVVFCGSYPQITNALYLATCNYRKCPVTIVIPAVHNLFRFFQVINDKVFQNSIKLIYLELYQSGAAAARWKIKKVSHILPDIVKERRYLREIFNKHFTELKGAEIFFSSRCFCPYTFYLLKRLSGINTLIHIGDPSLDAVKVDKFTPTNIIDWARLIILKLVYGRGITMGRLPSRDVPCMSDKFFSSEVDKAFSQEERDEMLGDFDLSKFQVFNVDEYDVIYFAQNAAMIRKSRDTLIRELAGVFNILCKYFPEGRIAVKYHPRGDSDKTMISTGIVLDDFIPAECLYSDKVKMYLSPYSMSIANVGKGLVVSLLDLISVRNEEIRQLAKERLAQLSHSEILFPKSLEEFEKILIDLKEQKI
jgi:hypothetical protein